MTRAAEQGPIADWIGHHGERQVATGEGFGYFAHLSIYDYAVRQMSVGRFVDAGCGSGYGCAFVRDQGVGSVLGLERTPAVVQALRTRYPGVTFAVCDLSLDLPVAPGSVDLLFCSNVLEHVAYPDVAIEAFARSVALKGRVVIAVPPISDLGAVVENARNLFHINNLPHWTWRTKLERFFHRVQPVRHWLADETRLPAALQAALGREVTPDPAEYGLQDFVFEPVDADMRGPTLTAVFDCAAPRIQPLAADHEIGAPHAWCVRQAEAEARQEAFVALEDQLAEERRFWRGEIGRLRSWMTDAVGHTASAQFIVESVMAQLELYV